MTAPHSLTPASALALLRAQLRPVETELLPWTQAAGRVLAQTIRADRPSPPHDVAAMDGYAVRLADLQDGSLPVAGVLAAGQRPPERLGPGIALKIFTGACVPAEVDAIIPREDVVVLAERMTLQVPTSCLRAGQHIRRRGENLASGEIVLHPGTRITAPVMAALASFGRTTVEVFRSVRLALLITGDELLEPGQAPEPWQIRDSNGPQLAALLAGIPWLDIRGTLRVQDELAAVTTAVAQALSDCDGLFITGGVSAGDYDFVPAALESLGARVCFHKLPIRPGKPILAALGPRAGQVILALPGNPVSVLTTARYFGGPVLQALAGVACPDEVPLYVDVGPVPGPPSEKLWCYRPVRFLESGQVEVLASQGSGDLASAARSDGMIEVPPGQRAAGKCRFWSWRI